MIPKKLHYCWFGENPLPPIAEACISTWKDNLHNYDFHKWSESNLESNSPVVIDALSDKMWAFAADYVRLHALYNHGGVYLDTDMELIKPLDDNLMLNKCFLGEESEGVVSGGIIAAEKSCEFIKLCIEEMERLHSIGQKYTTIPKIITSVYKKIDDSIKPTVYSKEFFYPYNPYDNSQPIKQLMHKNIKNNTYAIHHWEKSWELSITSKIRRAVMQLIGKFIWKARLEV